jgi:DNA polymerase-3 subunit delta'
MTESNLISADQIEGYPHPKVTEKLFGHQFAEQEFINCFKSNKLHHGWLITGTKGIGKATFAWQMAKFLLTQPIPSIEPNGLFGNSYENQNSDLGENLKKAMIARILAESEPRLVVVRKSFDEKRKTFRSSIRVDEVRHLKTFFSLSVSDGGGRVAIIDCAEDMNINAANALLKTLEEPPKDTVFLLVSHNPQSLLPTIKSRCRELRLRNLTESDLKSALKQMNLTIPENDSKIHSLLGSGSVGNSIRLLEHDGAGLYRTLLSFLNQLPNLNGFELEKFIGTFSGNKNRSRLELFIELLNMVIARLSKAGIMGYSSADKILEEEKEIFTKLCQNRITAKKWAELAQTQSENLKHGLAVNLDPSSLILDTFFRIEDCARTVR